MVETGSAGAKLIANSLTLSRMGASFIALGLSFNSPWTTGVLIGYGIWSD